MKPKMNAYYTIIDIYLQQNEKVCVEHIKRLLIHLEMSYHYYVLVYILFRKYLFKTFRGLDVLLECCLINFNLEPNSKRITQSEKKLL